MTFSPLLQFYTIIIFQVERGGRIQMSKKVFSLPKWILLKNYTIEKKLLFTYPILIVLSILVVSLFAIIISMQLFKEKSITYSNHILEKISQTIDTQLMRIDRDTYLIIQDKDIRAFFLSEVDANTSEYYRLQTSIQSFLTNFLLSHPEIESMYLINPKGEVISTLNDTSEAFKEHGTAYYHQQAKVGDGKLVWLKAHESAMGNRVIPVVRQINDLASLHHNGTLLMFIRESAINRLFVNESIGLHGSMMILDQEGSILSSQDAQDLDRYVDQAWHYQLTGSTGYFFEGKGADQVYINYYKSSFTNWTYLFRIPNTELYTGVHLIRNLVLFAAIFFTIVAVMASRAIARNISKPITRVIEEMKNIEKNQLLVNLAYDGKDELTSLASTFNYMMDRIRRLIKKETELQRMQHELEMRALQAEINPHFLYNTLEAINWMGRMNHIPQICDMTLALADIMRYNIDRKRNLVTVAEECEHAKKYLDIVQFRYKGKLQVFIDVPCEIVRAKIPKLTLQPIIENAIIHGLDNKVGERKLRIIAFEFQDRIFFKIEDNGCGMEQQKIKDLLSLDEHRATRGIGIHNVHKRLKLYFGESYGLEMESVVGKGTRVLISIPKTEVCEEYVQSADCG